MVDIDSVEMCKKCQMPLALIETVRAGGKYNAATKPVAVTRHLAESAGIPAFVVEYTVEDDKLVDITARKVSPIQESAEKMSPEKWSLYLHSLRSAHICGVTK